MTSTSPSIYDSLAESISLSSPTLSSARSNSPKPASSVGSPSWPRTDMPKEEKEDRRSQIGPQRSLSLGGGYEREKKKRSRVTPEQLAHLENFFAQERSPTARRRREISDLLGMHDRQTQIWFQNRRAKEKQLSGKSKARSRSAEIPFGYCQDFSGLDVDISYLIHEQEPVTLISCSDITIGTWRRIATSRQDLIVYICHPRRCLAWYIQSSGYGYKMEIPFEVIAETELIVLSPGQALVTFILSRPPLFFMESINSPTDDGTSTNCRCWTQCSDWTEGQQATLILRHELVGAAIQLSQVVHDLRANQLRPQPQIHSPSGLYPSPSSPPVMIPQPPFTSLGGTNGPLGSPVDHNPDQATVDDPSYLAPTQSAALIQRLEGPNLTSRFHHSYMPSPSSLPTTLSNRQSLTPLILSAPANAQGFFLGSTPCHHHSDTMYQFPLGSYRRHSFVTIPTSYHASPSPPPPAISYPQRSSDDISVQSSSESSYSQPSYPPSIHDVQVYDTLRSSPLAVDARLSKESDEAKLSASHCYTDSSLQMRAAYYPTHAYVSSSEYYPEKQGHPQNVRSYIPSLPHYSYTCVNASADML